MRGLVPSVAPLPVAEDTPRAALERVLTRALQRPPCVVSFSGGRDSSAVLATATVVARRTGLPPPVPATIRSRTALDADESRWQESVIRHLGVDEWIRVEVNDEYGLLGEVARAALRRHGLLWPANTHFHAPILRAAAGGTVLTGIDGDGLFGAWDWTCRPRRRYPPSWRYMVHRGVTALPQRVRRTVVRRHAYRPPWVRREAGAAFAAARAAGWSTEPWRWDRRIAWYQRQRHLAVLRDSMRCLAEDTDTVVVHPLMAPEFLAALARLGGRGGLGDRTAIMRRLVGTVLPDEILARTSQAYFDEVFWTPETRALAAAAPEVAHPEFVDADAARAEWASPIPNFGSAVLLQATWLHTQTAA